MTSGSFASGSHLRTRPKSVATGVSARYRAFINHPLAAQSISYQDSDSELFQAAYLQSERIRVIGFLILLLILLSVTTVRTFVLHTDGTLQEWHKLCMNLLCCVRSNGLWQHRASIEHIVGPEYVYRRRVSGCGNRFVCKSNDPGAIPAAGESCLSGFLSGGNSGLYSVYVFRNRRIGD
jgi:hypothetical protein